MYKNIKTSGNTVVVYIYIYIYRVTCSSICVPLCWATLIKGYVLGLLHKKQEQLVGTAWISVINFLWVSIFTIIVDWRYLFCFSLWLWSCVEYVHWMVENYVSNHFQVHDVSLTRTQQMNNNILYSCKRLCVHLVALPMHSNLGLYFITIRFPTLASYFNNMLKRYL